MEWDLRPRRLTDAQPADEHPSWSSDGRRIAYQSWGDIHVMDSDGSNSRNLTNRDSRDQAPSFFDPAGLAVSPVGRAALTWGWIKETGAE